MTDTAARLSNAESGNSGKSLGRYNSDIVDNYDSSPDSGLSTILFHAFDTVRRHKYPIAGAGIAGILLGLVIALLTPAQYRASTRIAINPEPTEILPRGPQERSGGDLIYDQTPMGLIQARSVAERVARELSLASNPLVVDQTLPRDTREKVAVGVVQQGRNVEKIPQSRLVDISFDFGDPELAARIANGLAENFIQANLDRRFDQARFVRKYLEDQLQTTRDRLEESERDILAFERSKDIVTVQDTTENGSPTSQSISNLQVKSVAGAYADAQKKRIIAEQEYRKLSRAPIENIATAGIQEEIVSLRLKEAELSKTFLPDYPELAAIRAQINALTKGISETESRVGSKLAGNLRAKYEAALAEEQQFRNALENLKKTILDERVDNARYTILARDVDANRELYNALLEQYKKVGAVGGVGENEVAIVDRATPPGGPFWPNIPLNIFAGLIVGSLIGFFGAFIHDLLREKIVRPADVENRLKVKSLGAIPDIGNNESVADMLEDPKSPVTEAYLSVTNLLRLATKHGIPRTLLVTSTIPEEGKSSSSYGLARSFAKSGKRVLLIDADLRRPTFRVGDNSNERGLSNLLAGEISLDEAIVPGANGVSYILTGGIPPNPSELFSTESIATLIEQLRSRFDVTIFDAPPILSLVDAPALAARCDAALLIIQSDRIRVPHAQQSLAALRNAGAYVVGALVTKYDADRDSYSYDYGYGSGYGYSYGNGHKNDDDEVPSRMIVAKKADGPEFL